MRRFLPKAVCDMHEFSSFVYLGMQKTGSTFISTVLDKFCVETGERKRASRVPQEARAGSRFYFISIRDPLEAYLSLYSYGCEERGGLRSRFEREDREALYDGTAEGFRDWLAFVLEPENAAIFGRAYAAHGGGRTARLVGLQSFRFLRAALPATDALGQCADAGEIRALYARAKLPDVVLRNETLREDLCALLSGPLRYAIADLDAALAFVRDSPPINASNRVVDGSALDEALAKRLREREWFLCETFGY
jgi:hypothetical protein